jgi:hypothetical protein
MQNFWVTVAQGGGGLEGGFLMKGQKERYGAGAGHLAVVWVLMKK